MNRRQFVLTTIASATGLMMPQLVSAAVIKPFRPPLILHTVILRPPINNWDTGNSLSSKKPNGQGYMNHQGIVFAIGDQLGIEHICVDMGHHLIGLSVNGNGIRQFRSWIVGGMIERGEPLTAIITDSSQQDLAFRVDIVLNRPLISGERIPLIDPVSKSSGKSAQIAKSGNNSYESTNGEWNPVRALPWYRYRPALFSAKPTCRVHVFPCYVEDTTITSGLMPINPRRRNVWHPTPWNDLRPAVPILTQNGADFAYMTPGIDHSVEQLLLRGENVEAKMITPGYLPRGILVNLSLVC